MLRPATFVMDVGVYDGADTDYYLSLGYSVLGVEAHPGYAKAVTERFQKDILRGALVIEQAAIGATQGMTTLHLSGSDPGSGSTRPDRIAPEVEAGVVSVPSTTMGSLLEKYGVPFYLKCDIEGSDRHCILGLDREHRPDYVSFEIGPDAIELLTHLRDLGYTGFKIINQLNFKPLSYFDSPLHVLRDKVRRIFGRPPQKLIRMGHRKFIAGHSSGPMGENTAGRWLSSGEALRQWKQFCDGYPSGSGGWWDLHARLS